MTAATYTRAATDKRPLKGESFRHVPEGRYALYNKMESRWHFFQVDQLDENSKWKLWTFVREIRTDDSTNRVSEPQRSFILRHIAENPLGAMTDYGKQVGECGKCHRTLTDPESIRKGIGPVCAKQFS